MNFINYFDNISEFKYKKDIIKEINMIYHIDLSDKDYKNNINNLLKKEIIDKSSKKGKCGYISVSFLKSKNFSDGALYFNSLKNKKHNAQDFNKKHDIEVIIPFNKNDCIIELNLMDEL